GGRRLSPLRASRPCSTRRAAAGHRPLAHDVGIPEHACPPGLPSLQPLGPTNRHGSPEGAEGGGVASRADVSGTTAHTGSWRLTLDDRLWRRLHEHLFPGDGDEHGAVVLTG